MMMEAAGFNRVSTATHVRLTYLNADDTPDGHHVRLRDVREWSAVELAPFVPGRTVRIKLAFPWILGRAREEAPIGLLGCNRTDPFALEMFTPDIYAERWLYSLFPKVTATVKGCSAAERLIIHGDATPNPRWEVGLHGLTGRHGHLIDPHADPYVQYLALDALPDNMKWPEEW